MTLSGIIIWMVVGSWGGDINSFSYILQYITKWDNRTKKYRMHGAGVSMHLIGAPQDDRQKACEFKVVNAGLTCG